MTKREIIRDIAERNGLTQAKTRENLQAREERFPFANEAAYGGCCVDPLEKAIVLFCDGCRQESQGWAEQSLR